MRFRSIQIILVLFLLAGCSETGLYEKVYFMKGNAWSSQEEPSFEFEVKDTSTKYQLYFLIRHADAYEYNNVWISLKSQLPGDSIIRKDRFDIPLADQKKWLGSGMDDIFDHRVLLYREPVKFSKTGLYKVDIGHEMRVEPLEHVFNVGLRIEKVN
ncbi:MAG: gliding motility lipoprotein GldH [Bacteroidota bacterium]|jgi:gliding motility-associated lipoprotein GldH